MNVQHACKFSIILAVFVLYSGWSLADAWQHTVATRVSTEYESNPAMSPANPGDVKRILFEPSYTLLGRIGENEWTTGLALQMARSSNEILSPNRDSPSAFLNWQRQSEMGEFRVSSRYAEIATRDAGVEATGFVPAASIRASRTLSGRWSSALSEHSIFSVESAHERVTFSGGNFIDYASRTGSMMFNYDWSENGTPFLQMTRTDYEPVDTSLPGSFTNAVLAGLNWRSSESLEGSLTVGKSRVSDGEISTQGAAAVRYTRERNHLNFSLARQTSPSGLGGFITTDQAIAGWNYGLSERSNIGIDLGWQQSHLATTDTTSNTAGAWLQHELNSFWGLRTYYQVRNVLNGGGMGDATSYILGFSLAYTHADF